MRTGLLALILAAFAACGEQDEGDDGRRGSSIDVILVSTAYFSGPGGEPVAVGPGAYDVFRSGDSGLRLRPREGDDSDIRAMVLRHEVEIDAPSVVLLPRGDHGIRLVLLLPDGDALDAGGSTREGDERLRPAEPWEILLAHTQSLLHGIEGTSILAEKLDGLRPTMAEADSLLDSKSASPPSIQDLAVRLDRKEDDLRSIAAELTALAEDGASPELRRALRAVEGTIDAVGKTRSRVDEKEIYLGDPKRFEFPAVVDVDAVYRAIPEYREIVRADMSPTSPRYLMLMRRASERFLTALEKAARKKGYDLIGGLGSIRVPDGKVPNATKLVISLLAD